MLVKIKRKGVDTVALASGFAWSVGKNMAEVSTAGMAGHFCTSHPVAGVFMKINAPWQCTIKTWPTAPSIVLGVRTKQLSAAICTNVHTVIGDIE